MQEIVVSGGQVTARERVLEVGYGLFSRRGVRDVTLDEVAARSGVTIAELEREFPTRDDLVLAILERREQRWTVETVEAEARARGAREMGSSLLAAYRQ